MDVPGLTEALEHEFGYRLPLADWLEADDSLHEETLRERIVEHAVNAYQEKEAMYGPEIMRRVEKGVLLHVLDQSWKEHLAAMDYLRQSVGLRGYAQKNPKQEYKRESFEMFTGMLDQMKQEVATVLARIQIHSEQDAAAVEESNRQRPPMQFQHEDADSPLRGGDAEAAPAQAQPYVRKDRKIGRNEKCWCGSGKKFKHCHGRLNQ